MESVGLGKDLTLNQTIFRTSTMLVSKRNYHVFSGFLMGIGLEIIIAGFLVWFLTDIFLGTLVSPSASVFKNQLPFLSASIIGVGFVFMLLGVYLEKRIKT